MIRGMTESADLYRLLQVKPNAECRAIRAAYRKLAWRYHPDVGGSERTMAALNEAWRILRDPATRARYDGRRAALMGREPGRPTPAAGAPRDEGPAAAAAAQGDHQTSPAATAQARSRRTAAPGRPDGPTILDFGRYEGWSLLHVAAADPDYLEWLARTSIGRRLQPEIAVLLAPRHAATMAREDAARAAARPARRWARSRSTAVR
jgi:curved DNA-binding protein CbpA